MTLVDRTTKNHGWTFDHKPSSTRVLNLGKCELLLRSERTYNACDCIMNIYLLLRQVNSIMMIYHQGSYNYLGFAENEGPCASAALEATSEYGCGVASSRRELGTMAIHRQLESLVAEFLGTEDAITFGMGFATNSMNIPALMGKGKF